MAGLALELQGLEKSYDGVKAVDGVELSVRAASTTVLIGPSGCGKSTMLRLIIGLTRPDTGRIRVGGELLDEGNLLRMRRRMGYVIQDGGLFPHLTARQNISLLVRHLRWNPSRIRNRVGELVGLTRLPEGALERYPAQLSGGQQQRVSLMRALMLDPELLLMDEPLGRLDPMIRAELQDELREIFRALKKTVVLVTHDMAEAAYFADTIVLMRDGRVVQEGRPIDLQRSPADSFVTRFLRAQQRWVGGEAMCE
jgi:osmoprotectant transport system ATP-binding protein